MEKNIKPITKETVDAITKTLQEIILLLKQSGNIKNIDLLKEYSKGNINGRW